ncbi:phosphatase PAP2 family protein [Candidatus Acetothermia bacterium]|nr:phosphatase PAP2 family protein [Candidatus Acetothermia bacterium]
MKFFSQLNNTFWRYGLCATLLGILIEKVAHAQESKSFDQALLETIHQSAPSNWEFFMKLVTDLGSLPVLGGLLVIAALYFVWRRQWKDLGLIVAAGLLTLALREGLKQLFHRTRPELWQTSVHEDSYSFPSGHALGSVIAYGVLVYLAGRAFPQWRWALWSIYVMLVALIGYSRLYLGVHWPTDVLGGWVIGAVALGGLIYWHKISVARR